MKTMIIHPVDPSTAFLGAIYANKRTKVIDEKAENLHARILEGDREICLGHGAPQGLFGYGRMVINETHASALREHKNNIYIWCNADCFVRQHGLKGFATGMFISEDQEARIFGVKATPEEIDASNRLFAEIIGDSLDLAPDEIRRKVMREYTIAGNDVVAYNRNNMFSF